jgi:hypothetical protein
MNYNSQGYAVITKRAWSQSIFLTCKDPLAAADEAPGSLLERVRDGRATMGEALERYQCPDLRKPSERKGLMHVMEEGQTSPNKLMADVVSKINRFKTVSVDTEAVPAVKGEAVNPVLVCAGFPDGTAYVFDRRLYEQDALGRHWSYGLGDLWNALDCRSVTVIGSNVETDLRGGVSGLDCVSVDTQKIATFLRRSDLLPWQNMDLSVESNGLKVLPALVFGHNYAPVFGAKAHKKRVETWRPHGRNAPVRFAQLPSLRLMNSLYGWKDWTVKNPGFVHRRKVELQVDYVLNDVAASPWLHVVVLGYMLGVAGYEFLLPDAGEKVEKYAARLSTQLRDGQSAWLQLPLMRGWSRRELSQDDPMQVMEHEKVVLDWGGPGVSKDGIDWNRVDLPFAFMQAAHEIDCTMSFALEIDERLPVGGASSDYAAGADSAASDFVSSEDLFSQYRSGRKVTHGFGPPGASDEVDTRAMLAPKPLRAVSDHTQVLTSDAGKGGCRTRGSLAAATAKARAKVVSKLVEVECEVMRESGVDVNAMTDKQRKEHAMELRSALKQARKKLKERGSSLVVSSLVPSLLDASKLKKGLAKRADGKLVPYSVDSSGRRPTQPVGISRRELVFSYPSRLLPRSVRAAPLARRTCCFCGKKSHRAPRADLTEAEKSSVRKGHYKYCPQYRPHRLLQAEDRAIWRKQCSYPLCTSDSVVHDTGACPDIGKVCQLCHKRGHGRQQCQQLDEDELKNVFLAHKAMSQFRGPEFQFDTDDRSELEWVVFDRDGDGNDDDAAGAEFRGVYMTAEQMAQWVLCDTRNKRKEFIRELYSES